MLLLYVFAGAPFAAAQNKPLTNNSVASPQASATSTAVLALDANVSKDNGTASASITSPSFSTTAANELVLAFVSTDYRSGANTTVTTVSGGGLSWAMASRANTQSGTAEVWRALAPSALTGVTVTASLSQSVAASLTVLSITGVDSSGNGSGAIGAANACGSASGAPTCSLVTTRANSWVFGVGDDWSDALARTVGSGQTLLHQYLAPAGDTYWVQQQSATTPASGTSVTINDTAPTSDRFNLSIVEVLPAITGTGDTTPPTVSITSPANKAALTGTITIAATATDNVAVANVQFLADGAPAGNQVTTTPYTISYDTSVLSNGSHTLGALATDTSGNTATATITVTTSNASPATQTLGTLNGHTVLGDSSAKIISWITPQQNAYDTAVRNDWNFLLTGVPKDPSNGLPAYYTRCYLYPDLSIGVWPHNPAGLYSMLTESALMYYAYSGDMRVINFVTNLLTFHLAHGLTPSTYSWATVPYASSDSGSTTYQGASYGNGNGQGDGTGVLEPDKIGELGYALLRMYEFTGNTSYLNEAIQSADQLASHVRTGTSSSSPWPHQVFAQSNVVRDDYASDALRPIQLLDELIRLNLGNVATYQTTRQIAWTWLMTYPVTNNKWANYFEDTPGDSNYNQYVANETARYLLMHPEMDPNWQAHALSILTWVENRFAQPQFGANSIGEQTFYDYPMGSHTSRYASVEALYYEKTGDATAKEKAYRAFNWAIYMTDSKGHTIDGPAIGHLWFTDGYGEFIRHFLNGMASAPDWAPTGANHLLRSTSVVPSVTYLANEVDYITYDTSSTDILKLNFVPGSVVADGQTLAQRTDLTQPGWTYDSNLGVVRVYHTNSTHISVANVPDTTPPTVAITSPANNATVANTVPVTATASDDVGVSKVEFYLDNALKATVTTGPYTWNWDSTQTSNGAHVISAKAYDAAQNNATASVNVTVNNFVDTTPPTVPTSLTATAVSTTQINLLWAASTDPDSPVAGYRVYRNTVQVGTTATTSYQDKGLSPSTSYSYTVAAFDPSNNLSAQSAPPVSATTLTPTPPTVSITAPASGATVSGSVTITASASDSVGVTGVQFRVDAVNLGARVTTSPYQISWNTQTVANGSHTIDAIAYDAAGLTGTATGVPVTVSNAAAATLAIDVTVSLDQGNKASSITSPAFTTTAAKELILVFVSSDSSSATSTAVNSVTGGGLTWAAVKRANTQKGDAEIWAATAASTVSAAKVTANLSQSVAASITVVAFKGGTTVAPSVGASNACSAASGAPTCSLATTVNNSWVLGVGDDWDNAIGRTVGASQTMVHQYLASVGDTYWVQRRTATTPLSGTSVAINDTAPTTDKYNLAVVEVKPGQ